MTSYTAFLRYRVADSCSQLTYKLVSAQVRMQVYSPSAKKVTFVSYMLQVSMPVYNRVCWPIQEQVGR